MALWWKVQFGGTRFRFADGTELTILARAEGTNVLKYDPAPYRLARRLSPKAYLGMIPPPRIGGHANAPGALKFLVKDPSKKTQDMRYSIDELGTFLEESSTSSGSLQDDIYTFEVSVYPRREKSFRFALVPYDRSQTNFIRLQNPVRGPFPEWKASALPITVTNPPVKLTLEDYWINRPGPGGSLELKWKMETEDANWARAEKTWRQIQDPTGNSAHNLLSLAEPVWRIRQYIQRVELGSFTREERISFTNVVVPGTNSILELGTVAASNGWRVALLGVAGEGKFQTTNWVLRGANGRLNNAHKGGIYFSVANEHSRFGRRATLVGTNIVETWECGDPSLIFETSGLVDGVDVFVYVRKAGETGERDLPLRGLDHSPEPNSSTHCVPLKAEPNSLVDIDVVVSRALVFDFYVAAPRVSRGENATD